MPLSEFYGTSKGKAEGSRSTDLAYVHTSKGGLQMSINSYALAKADLQMGFYSSCPKAEKIVQDYVYKHIPNAPSLPAALIRLHFHDCFLRGCDASILLNFTSSSGNQTEKFAIPNLTVRGFGFIDEVKSLLEKECPGIVCCADIVTLVARDSIVATGGPSWKVPTGRKDGLISNGSETIGPIPAPSSNLSTLQTNFANQGLDLKDLVVLSGGDDILYLSELPQHFIDSLLHCLPTVALQKLQDALSDIQTFYRSFTVPRLKLLMAIPQRLLSILSLNLLCHYQKRSRN